MLRGLPVALVVATLMPSLAHSCSCLQPLAKGALALALAAPLAQPQPRPQVTKASLLHRSV